MKEVWIPRVGVEKFSAARRVRAGRLLGRKQVIFHICAGWTLSRGPRVNRSPLAAAGPLYRRTRALKPFAS